MSEEFANKYPQLAKMAAVKDKSQAIGDFIEWAVTEKELTLCRFLERDQDGPSGWYPEQNGPGAITALLAEFFGVDLDTAEEERRALLSDFVAKAG